MVLILGFFFNIRGKLPVIMLYMIFSVRPRTVSSPANIEAILKLKSLPKPVECRVAFVAKVTSKLPSALKKNIL